MFKCDKCGQCCRSLKHSDLYADLDRGDGVCRYLKGNLCSIYDHRPLKCRIDEGYEAFYKDIMTKEEYYRLNYYGCEQLKQKADSELSQRELQS